MLDEVWKKLVAVVVAVSLTGGLYAADSRWLQKTSFEDYLQQQIVRDNQAELRSLDRRIVDVQSDLKYGNLTSERRAQLEQMLQLLMVQREELQGAIEHGVVVE